LKKFAPLLDEISSDDVKSRTKHRGTVASILSGLTFSLLINAGLDACGRIEPSTSTVFVGMVLGNTWGFVLDMMLGTDEGFREYLFDPSSAMKYALGALASARYGRYLVTIVYDMFFSVILFKFVYSRLVTFPGLSKSGNAWLANGASSFMISFITFQVYTNMTRFQWAYPSGAEDPSNQWISGSTMVLATTTMNMVYLLSETRMQIGERGINEPSTKLLVTIVTFCLLCGLQMGGVIDPPARVSATDVNATDLYAADTYAPLHGVCQTMAHWKEGLLLFVAIAAGCLGFVIFVTSRQKLREVLRMLSLFPCCCSRLGCARGKLSGKGSRFGSRLSRGAQSLLAKTILFAVAFVAVLAILLFFFAVPLWSTSATRETSCGV